MAIFRHILDIFLLSATFHKGTILDDAFSFSLQIVLSFAVKGEFKNSISNILCRHIWDTGRYCIAKISEKQIVGIVCRHRPKMPKYFLRPM